MRVPAPTAFSPRTCSHALCRHHRRVSLTTTFSLSAYVLSCVKNGALAWVRGLGIEAAQLQTATISKPAARAPQGEGEAAQGRGCGTRLCSQGEPLGRWCAVLYLAVLCSTVRCFAVICFAVTCCAELCCAVLYCAVLCCAEIARPGDWRTLLKAQAYSRLLVGIRLARVLKVASLLTTDVFFCCIRAAGCMCPTQVRDTTLLVDVMFAQLSVLSAAKIRETEEGGGGAFIDLAEKTKAGDVITVRIERVEGNRRKGTDGER